MSAGRGGDLHNWFNSNIETMYLLDLDKDNLGSENDTSDKDTMYGRIQNIKEQALTKNNSKALWANESKFTILQGNG